MNQIDANNLNLVGLSQNTQNDVIKKYEKLWQNTNEESRWDILKTMVTKSVIGDILNWVTKMTDDDLSKILVISWAWMLKLRLFESRYWSIRYHIFIPSLVIRDLMGYQIWEETHVHDFQAHSNVLLWEVHENRYTVHNIDEKQHEIYTEQHEFDDHIALSTLELYEKSYKSKDFDEKDRQKKLQSDYQNWYIKYTAKEFDTIRNVYTVFDSKKFINENGQQAEWFFPVGLKKFEPKDQRIVKAWESYFLHAEHAHRILPTKWISSTIFATDSTYDPVIRPKKDNILMRWHGKRHPTIQKTMIIRDAPNIKKQHKALEYIRNATYQALAIL